MLKNNFAAAKSASEPLEQTQEPGSDNAPDLGAQGNAFAGSRANADHEMYNAIHGAIMNGDTGGNSSIANAGMRLAAKFGSAATKSEKDAEKSRAAYMQVMMQNILGELGEFIEEAKENQKDLENAYQEFLDGNFDPLNNDEDRKLIEANNLTVEAWSEMSLQGQDDWFQETTRANSELIRRAEANYEYLENHPEALETHNGQIVDPVMRELVDQAQADGKAIDVENLTSESRSSLIATMLKSNTELVDNQNALEQSSPDQSNASEISMRANSFF